MLMEISIMLKLQWTNTIFFNILIENVEASSTKLGILGDFRFVHDNDPKYKFKIVSEWLSKNVKEVLPLQSTDLNAIEIIWGVLEKNPSTCSKTLLPVKLLVN